MLHSRSTNNVIRHLHGRRLQLIHHDKASSYKELLLKDGSVCIHHKSIQTLANEMYKVKNDLVPETISNIFCLQKQSQYNLQHQTDLRIPSVRIVYHGSESNSYLGLKFCTFFLQNQNN